MFGVSVGGLMVGGLICWFFEYSGLGIGVGREVGGWLYLLVSWVC